MTTTTENSPAPTIRPLLREALLEFMDELRQGNSREELIKFVFHRSGELDRTQLDPESYRYIPEYDPKEYYHLRVNGEGVTVAWTEFCCGEHDDHDVAISSEVAAASESEFQDILARRRKVAEQERQERLKQEEEKKAAAAAKAEQERKALYEKLKSEFEGAK